MRAHRFARAAPLIVLLPWLAGLGPCRDEEALRALEQKRATWIASTVPKAELWGEIERKGLAVKATRALEAEVARAKAGLAAAHARLAESEAGLAEVRGQQTQSAAALAQARAELEAARAVSARSAAVLQGFARRSSEVGAPP